MRCPGTLDSEPGTTNPEQLSAFGVARTNRHRSVDRRESNYRSPAPELNQVWMVPRPSSLLTLNSAALNRRVLRSVHANRRLIPIGEPQCERPVLSASFYLASRPRTAIKLDGQRTILSAQPKIAAAA